MFSLCVCPPALARPALFKSTLPQTPLRFASSAPWRRVRPFALPTSKKTKTQTFLKIRKMRTFRIFRFCPFEFLRKASLQLSRIWASAFHFSENTDVPDFPFFLARFVFRGKRRLVFCWCVSSLARPNWRGPPLTPLGLPLGDWRHCRSGRVWEERTSGRHPGVGNTERWDRARRSSKQREKESKPKACQPPGCQPRLRSSQLIPFVWKS